MDTQRPEFTGARRRKILLAAAAGNFAEWYDWGVYGVVATIIAAQFFEPGNPTAALLNTFAVFALGYIARPIGGIIFGRIGDKFGRKRALSMTILLTCGGTAAMGLLPTYDSVGLLAPGLLLVCRLAQSMGAGGEYASAIGFVYEHSSTHDRAKNVSRLIATTFVGIMAGSVLARLTSAVIGQDAFESYGWRFLFLLGLPLAAIGFYLRARADETPEFEQLKAERAKAKEVARPLSDALRSSWKLMLVFAVLTASYALISTTITSYLTTFLKETTKLTADQAYTATIVSNVAVIVATLVAGSFCDRIGLRKMFMIGGGVVAVVAVPTLVLASNGFVGGLLGSVGIGICKGLLAVPALVALSQLFPIAVRITAGALAYNVVQAVFGGTGPAIGITLNELTDGPNGFALYLAALAAITAVTAFAARSTFANDTDAIQARVTDQHSDRK
ncbi:MFS transporter [Mycolicibacterium sediminis]|uniref:MFS transporter n=1 Tax=Mycolicibacterium sediminis TaxID=1286180 RepID=A0A7I7QUR6_9MYCO|nr:MFS transporter [Mycolicibacterium sediminis]BBY30005.1 MFS transporter [Mycolicibacterium sediminis]